MTREEAKKLDCGIYRIHWKDDTRSSLASVGVMSNGDRWMSPTNWSPDCVHGVGSVRAWESVEKVELLMDRHSDSIKTDRVVANLEQECDELVVENARLKRRNFVKFREDECWVWHGDGSDNLESLVCPVVISAEDLKDIIEVAKEEVYSADEKTTCAVCGEYKYTPLRRDDMGGYVCLTCIDKELNKRNQKDMDIMRVKEKEDLMSRYMDEEFDKWRNIHQTESIDIKTSGGGEITQKIGFSNWTEIYDSKYRGKTVMEIISELAESRMKEQS